jgi:TP901 family phage tail tape measure protein
MAQKVEKLIIEIAGDATKFKKELQNLKRGTKGFQSNLKSAAMVGSASFLAIGSAAAALGTKAVSTFADFETGLVNVAKTTNLEGAELDKFKNRIIELSKEIPVTTERLFEIATAAGQLGIKGVENLSKFTEVIAKLGRTTDVDGEAAALAIARILNLTNESIDTVDKFGAVLVDLGNNFAATESEILEIARDVAKGVVNFKLASKDVLGLSAAMASLGIQSEAGGTVINKSFQAIDSVIREQTGPAFERLIELTGLTNKELTETFATDATKVFQLFLKGLGKVDKEGGSVRSTLEEVGLTGIRVNKILPTLASRADIVGEALKRAGEASKEGSALNEEAAKAFETTASRLQIAQSKINDLFRELGEEIAPAVIESVDQLTEAAQTSSRGFANIVKSFLFVAQGFVEAIGIVQRVAEFFRSRFDRDFVRVETQIREQSRFLKEELKKRNISEEQFLKIQQGLRDKSEKNRQSKTDKAQKKLTKTEVGESNARIKQAEKEADKKAIIEERGLEQIQKINKVELQIAKANQRGANQEFISILEDKFRTLKQITSFENQLAEFEEKGQLSVIEEANRLHTIDMLGIAQARFDDLLIKQRDFDAGVIHEVGTTYDIIEGIDPPEIHIPIIIDDPTDDGTGGGDGGTGGGGGDGGTGGGGGDGGTGGTGGTTTVEPINCSTDHIRGYKPRNGGSDCAGGYVWSGSLCEQQCCSGYTRGGEFNNQCIKDDAGGGGGGSTGPSGTGNDATAAECAVWCLNKGHTDGSSEMFACVSTCVNTAGRTIPAPSSSQSRSFSLSSNLSSGNFNSSLSSGGFSGGGDGGGGNNDIKLLIELKDDLVNFITVKQSENDRFGL